MTTKDRILEAAMDAFAERGFRGTTTRDIVQRAGVNLAALNYHWGSKEQLWEQVCTVLNARILQIAQGAVCHGRPFEEALPEFIGRVFDGLVADPRPLRVAVWASMQADAFDYALVSRGFIPAVDLGTAALHELQAAGVIDAEIDIEIGLVLFYGLLAEPFLEPSVHRALYGADLSDPLHAARVRAHVVASAMRLLGLDPPTTELPPGRDS